MTSWELTVSVPGILTGEERVILEKMEAQTEGKFGLYWMPCVWIEEVLNHMFKYCKGFVAII